MNIEWFTATQLAGLPGLPKSSRNIRINAQRGNWQSRPRVKGKGREYHLSSLPEQTQAHLAKLEAKSRVSVTEAGQTAALDIVQLERLEQQTKQQQQAKKSKSLQAFQSLPHQQQSKANARMIILQKREIYLQPYRDINRLTDGEKHFDEAYKKQRLGFEDWIYQQVPNTTWQTCRRWLKRLDSEGLASLANQYGQRERAGIIESQPDLHNYLFAVITGKPHLAARPYVLERMISEKREDYPQWKMPSPSSIRRWLLKWKRDNGAAFAYLTNPDAYNNKHRPLYGKMYPWVQAPNDCWEFDSSPTDVQLQVEGKLVRYSIIAAIDVYTRRVKLLLSPTSNSEGICLLLRKCLLEWGILNDDGLARTDNGSDYVSKRVTAILHMLDIKQSRANAFSGWEKPFIERFFGTLSQGLFELLPGYIGHSVSDRQQIEAAKAFAKRIGEGKKQAEQEAIELALSPDELEQVINDWLEHRYHNKVHGGLKGHTPFQQYANSRYRPKLVPEVHSLDYLLNYVGDASVIRGGVKTGGIRYTAPELMNPELDRKRMRVFLDPKDVGRATLYPLDDWDTYIEAISDEWVGRTIDPAAYREQRKQYTKSLNQLRRDAKRFQAEFGINNQYASALAADKARNNLATLQLPGEITDNPALSALSNTQSEKPKGYSEQEIEALAKQRELMAQKEQQVKQQSRVLFRSMEEKAIYLAKQSQTRELTTKEKEFITEFTRNNQVGKALIEREMARSRQA
ncbi:DNA-binding protein [Thaumasiovibrio sp. DFM-14]|uniref:DNA-binding protein n=1 Tax=Thaumasiovibrio sp. DFM-14 TaxID=3384792 RepID=UPI0039A2E59B